MTCQNIDLQKSEQYILSIRLSTDGFSFSIHNPSAPQEFFFQTHPVNTMRSMAANVQSFLNDTDILKYQFKDIYILIHSTRYTLVPLEIFEDELIENFFYQNLPKQNNEIILCNILGNSNSVILFSIDKLTHLFLSEQFKNIHFFSAISPQIEYLASHPSKGNKMYINLQPSYIDILCLKKNKLQLVNTFRISNPNDRCYYVLNIWQQLQYDQEKDQLFLTGVKSEIADTQEILSDFIRNITSINPFSEYSQTTSTEYEHIPFDIQSLLTCV